MTAGNLGAIIAGGRSTRFGSAKALAEVAGEPIIVRVARTLLAAGTEVVVLTADPMIAEAANAPSRPDVIPGLGALGGIHTALVWARETDRPGILAVACDMPFLSEGLLRHILDRSRGGAYDLVAPEGGGPRVIEPLCAWYGVACLAAIEKAIERGDRRMIGFHAELHIHTVPLKVVAGYGRPEKLFLNVNSPEDRDRAETMAGETNPD